MGLWNRLAAGMAAVLALALGVTSIAQAHDISGTYWGSVTLSGTADCIAPNAGTITWILTNGGSEAVAIESASVEPTVPAWDGEFGTGAGRTKTLMPGMSSISGMLVDKSATYTVTVKGGNGRQVKASATVACPGELVPTTASATTTYVDSGHRAGQFCGTADHGKYAQTASGWLVCAKNGSRWQWRDSASPSAVAAALPVTGTPVRGLVALAITLCVVGIGAVALMRRRRVRFETPE